MGDVVIVDGSSADGVDEFLVQDCGVDEGGKQPLHLLFVAKRGVHLVGFLLQ